jgi:hypothetical protein
MSESATPTLSAANSVVSTVLSILKRLTAALQLLRLADEAIPTLVSSGATTKENADLISAQLPALRKDIDDQVNAAKVMMGSIQDRVESVAQFLLLHRKALRLDQSENLDHWLAQVRG